MRTCAWRSSMLAPASVLGQLVVGQDISALLRFRQVVQNQNRDLRESELLCCAEPPVPG